MLCPQENFEQVVEDLILAAKLYHADRARNYINYMEKGHAIFAALAPEVEEYKEKLQVYCSIYYPDICYSCGTIYNNTGSVLRTHCHNCKAGPTYRTYPSYEIQQLSIRHKIHFSWIEAVFAIASATRL